MPDLLPDEFAGKDIASYVARERKGRLVAIEDRYRSCSQIVRVARVSTMAVITRHLP